ncbi:translationally-controlled tumor protein homolog [Morone saxatilis]|uniref:translationally-controlled tumor protein homolog n=1 Tax=Morone saxatilis TaxID=34816 RepID=UPI0015E2369E|nr:translationally-controlled tumor protein homolog [Morone saxatilis]
MPRLAAASLFYLPRSVRATGLGSVPGKKNTEAAKMIIYQCIVTGDEMFSDIYKITESKDGIFYEVEGKHVPTQDMRGSTSPAFRPNGPLAEDGALRAHLGRSNNQREWRSSMLTLHPAFEAGSSPQDFKNLQFFLGESMNPDGMVGLLNYREDGVTPYMLFFKDGLLAEKC